jgi:hypothetical protein
VGFNAALTASVALTGGALFTSVAVSSASAAPAWPTAKGRQAVSKTIEVSGLYDGGLKRFSGTGALGDGGQEEDQDPIFKLKNGAVLKNVLLGAPVAGGIHCMGNCTLQNVWWEDIGEDAASFKGKSARFVYTVHGGGARKTADKVFQFNGAGKLVISKFQASHFGNLVRSCGNNCSTQYKRTIMVNDVDLTAPGKAIVGINTNYGDTASLRSVRIYWDRGKKMKTCVRYIGNNTGKEPKKTGSGPDGTHCRFVASDISYK